MQGQGGVCSARSNLAIPHLTTIELCIHVLLCWEVTALAHDNWILINVIQFNTVGSQEIICQENLIHF